MNATELIDKVLHESISEADGVSDLVELLDNANRDLKDLVQQLRAISRKLRPINGRAAGNMDSYMIPHIVAWTEESSRGGGDTIPEIIAELEAAGDED